MNPWIETITVVTEIFLALYFFSNYFSKIHSSKILAYSLIAVYGSIIFLLSVFSPVSTLHTFLTILSTYLFVKFYFKTSWLRSFYPTFLYLVSAILADVLCGALMQITGFQPGSIIGDGPERIIYNTMAKLLHLLCLYIILSLTNRRYDHTIILHTAPLCACLVLSFFVCYHNFTALISGAPPTTVIVETVGLLFINLVICAYAELLSRTYTKQQEAILAKQQLELRECYYQDLVERQEETRALWHDIKKYMATMETLVCQEKQEEAQMCLTALQESFSRAQSTFNTGNATIDSILSYGMKSATESGVDLLPQVWLDSSLDIPAADLFIIIGNTLDNAIEACSPLSSKSDRTIHLSLIQKNHILRYEIKNRFLSIQQKKKRIHGYGLRNVSTCVERNNGKLSISNDDGYFTVSILLNV